MPGSYLSHNCPQAAASEVVYLVSMAQTRPELQYGPEHVS